MGAAQHADRILAAWDRANDGGFRTELENALVSCRNEVAATGLEHEQRELLESVAQQLQSRCSTRRLEAGVALLRHLRTRHNRMLV